MTQLRRHVDGQPLLLVSRIVKDPRFAHVFVTRRLPDVIALSATSSVNCHVFPRSSLGADPTGWARDGDQLFAYKWRDWKVLTKTNETMRANIKT